MTVAPVCALPCALSPLTVRAVQTVAVAVPLRFALATSGVTALEAPLLP